MSGAEHETARLAGGDGHRPPTHSAYLPTVPTPPTSILA